MWEITRVGLGVHFVAAMVAASVAGCGSDAGGGTGDGSGGSAGASSGGMLNVGGTSGGGAGNAGASGGMGQGGAGNTATGGTPAGSGGGAGAPGATGKVSTGLDPNAIVGQLTGADALKICAAEERYVAMRISDTEAIRSACVLFAAISGGGATPTAAQCQKSVNDCLAMPDQISTMQECTIDSAGLASCSATVGELETCLTASVEAVKAAFASITCELYALSPAEYQARLAALQQPPPACMPLQMKCPSAFATR